MYAIASTLLQKHLSNAWEIIDGGRPVEKVVAWLRQGGHTSIDDEAARMVADLIERGRRTV